jgi:N-dimethylarginine dimethylaminohydrolase
MFCDGTPTAADPNPGPEMTAFDKKPITEDYKDGKALYTLAQKQEFCNTCYNPCYTYEQTERETQQLIKTIEEFSHKDGSKIKVRRIDTTEPKKIVGNYGQKNQNVIGTMDIFARDTIQVYGNVITTLEPGSPSRRGELLLMNHLLFDNSAPRDKTGGLYKRPAGDKEQDNAILSGTNAGVVSMLNRDTSLETDNDYSKHSYMDIEGGDFMLLGDTILIGYSDNKIMGSSLKGCNWYRQMIQNNGYDVKVVCLRLKSPVLHLDVFMSAPRPNFAMVAPFSFSKGWYEALLGEDPEAYLYDGDKSKTGVEPKKFRANKWNGFGVLKEFKLVKVNFLAAMKMAVNALPLNETEIITAQNGAYVDPCCNKFNCDRNVTEDRSKDHDLYNEITQKWSSSPYGTCGQTIDAQKKELEGTPRKCIMKEEDWKQSVKYNEYHKDCKMGEPLWQDGKFDYVKEQLEKHNFNVHPIFYEKHAGNGGAIRCSSHPLYRNPGSTGM